MIDMMYKIHRSPDAPEGGAAPVPVEQTPVTEPAASPDMSNYVSRDDYDNLQGQFTRSEGRAKTAQRLLNVAQQMGYSDMDALANALPGMTAVQPSQQPQQNVYDQYPGGQEFYQEQQRPTHREGPSLEDIDQRIVAKLGIQQAMNSHQVGRDSENQLLASLIADENFNSIFQGLEQGEHPSVFDAAYSGSGSAASEIVASAIDNMMYGNTSKYGEDAPENLRGRTMPITDPGTMDTVRDRVVEGLKELAAMSVFAASKKGLQTAPSPEMVESEGKDIPRKDTLDALGADVANFSTSRFDDLLSSGKPSST
jgi:hypothetical protein